MVTPYYDADGVTLYCADARQVDVAGGSVAAVVTSPPYNVGLGYQDGGDVLAWSDYWHLAGQAAWVMYRALTAGGRVWVNTAVAVPLAPPEAGQEEPPGKFRVMLAHGWHRALADAGLSVVDQVAWCSARGAGTAWGSWASPAAPNLRGDWESVLVGCKGRWDRPAPPGMAGWRDTIGGWPALCSTVWHIAPARRDGHPAPFPLEVARRCIRLSTWPGEVVFDPFAGSGTTLLAARQLGRRAIGIERSEAYCELAVRRLAQGALDFGGAA